MCCAGLRLWRGSRRRPQVAKRVQVVGDAQALTRAAVEVVLECAKHALAERGRFTMALSGGSSVKPVYELLAQQPLEWKKVFLFWGDDRFVEPENPYSNYALAMRHLISKAPDLPPENVYPIPWEAPTPEEGAREYSRQMEEFFGLRQGQLPRLDVALNGMGPDGHTASLFPGMPALDEQSAIAVASHAGLHPWVDRITLTLPVFNECRMVLFAVSGKSKAGRVREVLQGPEIVETLPAQGVNPREGEAVWLLDSEAAALLDGEGSPD